MRRGFTMTELLVTVALVGVLAAIGITSWRESQARTLRAEVPANVEAIRVSQLAYFAAWDTFVSEGAWYPSDLALDGTDRLPQPWAEVGSNGTFDDLGWSPNAKVRGRYALTVGDETKFQVDGKCNVDGDEKAAYYYATEDIDGTWDTGSVNEF